MSATSLLFTAAPHAQPVAVEAATHLQASKYFLLAAFVMLLYDYLITLADEIEHVWNQPRSAVTYLFALNRYGSLLQRPVIVASFLSPAWSKNVEACQHSVRFSGGSTVAFVAIIMILRVWAIWKKDKRIIAILGVFWVFQVAFSGMALGFSKREPIHSPFWLMPLLTDTTVFALTLLRVFRYSKEARENSLLRLLIRDGALYFLCICSANFLNVVLFLTATEDLKAIGAGFSQVITSVLVSRLVLNLRNVRSEQEATRGGSGRFASPPKSGVDAGVSQNTLGVDEILGALGEETGTPTSGTSFLEGYGGKKWQTSGSRSVPTSPLANW
ncbi:hypothetical protein BU17DRAFT_70100 [Hysterangium stoloniferum]|nr:hypothetical protein BU17DRAFT_70100 [Hysterangium stoloniferum]